MTSGTILVLFIDLLKPITSFLRTLVKFFSPERKNNNKNEYDINYFNFVQIMSL